MVRLNPLLLLVLLPLLAGCYRSDPQGYLPGPGVAWSYSLGNARDLTADYIGDNIIVCSSSGALDWVDIRSGSVRYSVTDPQLYGNGLMWFASPDGQVYYMLRDGYSSPVPGMPYQEKLSCRDSSGELQWELLMPAGDSLTSSAIAADRLFLILESGNVMAVSRQGEMLWFRDLNAERLTGFAAFVSRQLVYLNRDGLLCVADMEGAPIWRSEDSLGYFSSTLELADGSLAIYDYPLALRYYDPAGTLLWRADFPDYQPGRGSLDGGDDVTEFSVDRMLDALPGGGCAVAHPDGRISAFDAAGRQLWRSEATGQAMLICADERGNVYGSVRGAELHAYDSQGSLAWIEDKLGPMNSAPSVDGLGHVYVETGSYLFCLDPAIPEIR
ncbi:MAG: PQQ-binding-like beta-propeller repeat protein [bacterium]